MQQSGFPPFPLHTSGMFWHCIVVWSNTQYIHISHYRGQHSVAGMVRSLYLWHADWLGYVPYCISLCLILKLLLRLADTYAAKHIKISPALHVCLNISVARPSFKNLRYVIIIMQTCVYIWKVTSSGRGKINGIQNTAKLAIFISAIRGHLENVNTLLTCLVTWSKNAAQIFERWSSNRVIETNVPGGSDFHVF